MADGRVVIDVILDDGRVTQGVANINNHLGGLQQGGERAALGIGKIVTALGLVALAKKGIDMVKGALDGAISRYDTLNGFPKILAQMGFDSEQSSKAINKLSDGIQGLPTTLDSVAATTQKLAVMTGDLDGAVDTTLALNNAFISSGSSSADASRGLVQYTQMLSKGSVDMMSWRTLQETMGVALNDTAKAFGFTGRSAQNDLYDALKNGDITFDQFNSKIIELSNGTNGFAERAKTASAGIRTAYSNMKTAIVRGVTSILGAIDSVLANTSFKNIEGVLARIGKTFSEVLTSIAEGLPKVVAKIKEIYSALKPWLPLIEAVLAGIASFFLTVAIFNSVRNAIGAIRVAWALLNATILANPIALIVAAIVAAAILIYIYWEPIKAFFIKLWEDIKAVSASVWDWLKGVWQSTVDWFKGLWSSISDFFSGLWEGIKSVVASVVDWFVNAWGKISGFFTDLWNGIVSIALKVWDTFTTGVSTVISNITTVFAPMIDFFKNMWGKVSETATTIWGNISGFLAKTWDNIKVIAQAGWELIKNMVLGPILLLIDLVTGNFDRFQSDLSQIWDNIKTAASDIWNALKDIVLSYIDTVINTATALWSFLVDAITGYFTAIYNTAVNIFNAVKAFFGNVWEGIKTVFSTVLEAIKTYIGTKFEEMKNTAKEKMESTKTGISNTWENIKTAFSNAIEAIKTAVKNKFEDIKSSIGEKMTAAKNKITEIWESVKTFFTNIDLKQIGKDIIQGLIDGITSKVKAVTDAIKNVTDSITGKIRDILGIKSPSRWMRDMIGKNMMLGWQIGIDREKGSMIKKSEQMTDWMKPDVPVVSGFVSRLKGMAAPIGNVMPISAVSGATAERDQLGKDRAGRSDINLNVYPQKAVIDESDVLRVFQRAVTLYD